jgi:hypothetical protein
LLVRLRVPLLHQSSSRLLTLGDRYPVPSYGLDVELLDRNRDGFLLGGGFDSPEVLARLADGVYRPTGHRERA